MKSPRLFLLLTLLLFSPIVSIGQSMITLHVNTEGLKSNPSNDPESFCYFENKGDVRTYMTVANLAEYLIWNGVSTTNEKDSIHIKRIQRVRGTNVFNSEKINSIGKEKVVRAIIYNPTQPGNDYKYKIHFKINGTGQNYVIDPLIRTNNTIIPKN